MSEVFISYKREDGARVRVLVEALRDAGLDVFWDHDIPTGDNWQIALEQALDEARLCLVIWTRNSIAAGGHFVREEARRAAQRNAYFGILLDPILPPLGFGEWQAFDAQSWNGAPDDPTLAALTAQVRARLSGTPIPPTTSSPSRIADPPERSRRLNVKILLLALVASSGLIATGVALAATGSAQCQAEENDRVSRLRRSANELLRLDHEMIVNLERDKNAPLNPDRVRSWYSAGPAPSAGGAEPLIRTIFSSGQGLEIADEDGKYMRIPPIEDVVDREGGELKMLLLRLFSSAGTHDGSSYDTVTREDLIASINWLDDRVQAYTNPQALRLPGGCGRWNGLIWRFGSGA